ncbi:BRO-N domain-containing protein [Blautia sp. MSJ-36]|uniref:BRO-N domain-containing protein n=1 Tax=Blautia sp. MSJ-36 TaxID=2841530 RepID=UPI001C12516F|nr:Bro-N domain-containing protein [Blautia sp. MSJ-36]MBU5447958.1 Bro-N domain-containing protein [Blautia sp. MSJ-36]
MTTPTTPSSSASQCEIFNHPEFGNLRCIEIDGEPWFVGKDVATALGYKNPRQGIVTNVDETDKGVHSVDTPSGVQKMTIINESGLYSLILSSKLESAKRFKRWVTSEVLPCIRKHGGYLENYFCLVLLHHLQYSYGIKNH